MSRCATGISVGNGRPRTRQGEEELLYKGSAPMTLTDWSQDVVPYVLLGRPLWRWTLRAPPRGTGERKPIEAYRNKSQNQGPRLSPTAES